MSGCWKDWNGLEEVTEVTAFWGEGIGRNSHTLELQELGGLYRFKQKCKKTTFPDRDSKNFVGFDKQSRKADV